MKARVKAARSVEQRNPGRRPHSFDGAPIEKSIGYAFRDADLLRRSLTHRSHGGSDTARNNEQLEFLGDAVLALAMSDLLLRRFPSHAEGELSKIRASLVNSRVLAAKATELDLADRLLLGKGEERTHGRRKPSILAAAYEAVLGAVYLDGGFTAAFRMVARHFDRAIEEHGTVGLQDYKTRLQELTQALFREIPTYRLVRESGPDHDKRFVVEIEIDGKVYGRGEGRSKKIGEQAAAMEALGKLRRKSSR